MTYRIVKKGSAGKYHLQRSGRGLDCNLNAGSLFNQVETDLAMKAKDDAFCRKCFGTNPQGAIDELIGKGLLKRVTIAPTYSIEEKENVMIKGIPMTAFKLYRHKGDEKTFAGSYTAMSWGHSDEAILKVVGTMKLELH